MKRSFRQVRSPSPSPRCASSIELPSKKTGPLPTSSQLHKVPQKLPIVLSPEEVVQFLGCVRTRKHRAILTTCYAAGLRISEAVALTLPTVDSKRMVIRVEQGKGRKDRYVMLSP